MHPGRRVVMGELASVALVASVQVGCATDGVFDQRHVLGSVEALVRGAVELTAEPTAALLSSQLPWLR